ncbi:MAG: dihydroorotase [Oscillospiraceae bacterium]|nr:dihydroorotase [Oscillospiraceae bacterium]
MVLLADAQVFRNGKLKREDILIDNGTIVSVGNVKPPNSIDRVVRLQGCVISPGFCDVHVHLREPGFSYKETIETGTEAAARGGYADVCAMPNVNPVPDSREHLRVSLDAFRRGSVRVHAVGSITVSEAGERLSDMEALAPHVVGFSDDGKGVQSEELMRKAMELARRIDRPVMAHTEDDTADFSQSEWRQIERDIRLVRETGCQYHVQHVSCAKSVELIRAAKLEGLRVTCETAPHYLCLSDDGIEDDGRFVMNPPIRSKRDQTALIEALADGVIDIIATDHAPHSAEEKSRGFKGSVKGVVGLETAFPVLYTKLVLRGFISLERLLTMLTDEPRKLIRKPLAIAEGSRADITALELNTQYTIDSSEFLSMGRATPFDGWRVFGRPIMTMLGGSIIYEKR